MKKTTQRLTISRKLFFYLAAYSIFISWLMEGAVQNYNRIDFAAGVGQAPTSHDFFVGFLIVLGIYAIRCFFLILPKLLMHWKRNLRTDGWLRGGILFAIPPELYLIYILNSASQAGSCGNSEFSCSFGALSFAFIFFASCVLQAVGMLIGGMASFVNSRRAV
jgi:hypothetical protein